uniref:Uncharacterized protein n=1 Tax=Arundo donax TaxID=35708 RepID=A0A0A9C5Q2_ARUDO
MLTLKCFYVLRYLGAFTLLLVTLCFSGDLSRS